MDLGFSSFPNTVWDGLCPQYDSRQIDKNPDFWMSDQITQEVIAIEQWLIDRMGIWNTLELCGPAQSFLTVKDDSSGLSWRGLVAGAGISLTYAPDAVTITTTAGAIVLQV